MESLLENPVRAVLYLKELTAIVQNQQSLIHTQRQRIDELERRLDELSAENRSLWEHQQLLQTQPPPGLVPPPSAPLPAPTTTAPAATVAQEPLQDHGQLTLATPEPPLQHHGQLLAQPQPSGRAQAPQSPHQHPVAPGAAAEKEKERPPSCCAAAGALLQHTSPAALGKGVLSRRPEYTLFIVLYPMGVTGELLTIYAALPFVRQAGLYSISLPNKYNFSFDYYAFLILVMISYIPLFPQLYFHMLHQRRKVLSRSEEHKKFD